MNNTSLLSAHPWLCLSAAFLAGMTFEWLLELFWFRARMFQLDTDLRKREREIEDTKFQLSRTQSDLRSKLDLVDALQKTRANQEAALQAARAEREEFETRLKAKSEETTALEATQREQESRLKGLLESESQQQESRNALEADRNRLVGRLTQLESEVEAARSRSREIEDELLAVTRANGSLAEELNRQRSEATEAARALAECEARLARLSALHSESNRATEISSPDSRTSEDTPLAKPSATREADLLADLESVARERNELAAELAALKAATTARRVVRDRAATKPVGEPGPTSPAAPASRLTPVEPDLFAVADDLETLEGVDGAVAQRLQEAGFTRFDQIARTTVERLLELFGDTDFKAQNFERWISQARSRLGGHET